MAGCANTFGVEASSGLTTRSRWLRRLPVVALALLLACPSTETTSLPPGPQDPVKSLAQLDAFADRVQREAMFGAWTSVARPDSGDRPKAFGILPMLLLTDDEVSALSARLSDPQHQLCLRAIHALAVRMQSETDPGVARVLGGIGALRQQIPDLGRMYTDEGNLARRKELWLAQADVATRLAPLLRQLASARKQWAWKRARLGYLELMQQHRGYDPAVVRKLEEEVRRALGAKDIPLGAFKGQPVQELLVAFGFVSVALATLLSSSLLLWGFRTKGAEEPG
jgi:hypothetical protein